MEHFQQYFDRLLPEEQDSILSAFRGNIVNDILTIECRREFGEMLA